MNDNTLSKKFRQLKDYLDERLFKLINFLPPKTGHCFVYNVSILLKCRKKHKLEMNVRL